MTCRVAEVGLRCIPPCDGGMQMSSKRRRFSGELKAKVALEALRGDRTSMDAPGDASIFSYGSVHAVRCCRRPHRLRQFRRRGPVWRYAGRVQIASASSSALRPGAGFPDPVSLTVCPYPSSALPASPTSMDAPGDASIFSYGSVHAVRCCRLSGLIDCGSSDAAGPYGDTRVGSKSLQRARRLCVRVLVFPTPSR